MSYRLGAKARSQETLPTFFLCNSFVPPSYQIRLMLGQLDRRWAAGGAKLEGGQNDKTTSAPCKTAGTQCILLFFSPPGRRPMASLRKRHACPLHALCPAFDSFSSRSLNLQLFLNIGMLFQRRPLVILHLNKTKGRRDATPTPTHTIKLLPASRRNGCRLYVPSRREPDAQHLWPD